MATGPFAANVKYLSDGNQEIAEYDGGSGALLRRYVYGPGIDEPVATIDAGGTRTYHHQDGLGSVIALSNGTGAATASFTHGPYGETPNAAGTAYRYTGRRIDPETGLYYYRARYYSPNLGRFMQTDPIGYQGGINLYSYVGNSPISLVDPTGLKASPQGNGPSAFAVALGTAGIGHNMGPALDPEGGLYGSFRSRLLGSAALAALVVYPSTSLNLGEGQSIARLFYRGEGFAPEVAESHMQGIDLSQPVDIAMIPKGTAVVQYQMPGASMGSYFAPMGTSPNVLGIDPTGRVAANYIATTDMVALRSTAATTIGNPRLSPQFQGVGGGQQFFVPNNGGFFPLP